MRGSRFMLAYSLGALSVLVAVTAAEWTWPGVLGRAGGGLHPGVAMTDTAPAVAPPAAPAVAIVPALADSALQVPVVGTGVGPADMATGQMPDAPVLAPIGAAAGGVRLLIPVQGVKVGSLVDTYEQSRGQGRRHDAIDIMAPRGTPVLAVSDGVVMKLFQSGRGGITLYELAPDRRTIYYYAHLDRYAPGIAEGQALRRGQLIGYVGNTGSAGPGNYHLHFEVSTTTDPAKYWGGKSENPYPLLH
ncbi:MAG TPA: M23 family metallopeptidase [Longimicrobium sp.]|nr:M23 family metallopeptidase [Longimicrobium sp.]